MPEHRDDSAGRYHGGRPEITAFLGALLAGMAIIGLFMFITWVTYNTG
jgi:hypothetical protein